MRVLVTGGAGFLGVGVIHRLLGRGFEPVGMDISDDRRFLRRVLGDRADQLGWFQGDVADPSVMTRAAVGCEAIIHLAGLLTPACQNDPVRGAQVNVIGTLNAFRAALRHGIGKVVYTSSISVFGPDGSGIPQPTTHYGAFKLANEGSARTVWESDRLTSFGIRPGIVYGPGRESGLTAGITQACRSAAAGEEYAIPFSGDVNLVYVDEVASAYEAALLSRQEGAQIFNMFGAVAKVAEVAAEIRRQVQGAAISVDGPALPFAALRTSNEPELAGLEKVDLPDGIAATIAHYGGAGGDN